MRQQSILTLAVILVGIPLAIGLIALRTGVGIYTIISVAIIVITMIALVRIWLGTGFTIWQGRRPEAPPERELIADADRPTLRIGIIVLAITVLLIIITAIVLALQMGKAPDPDLQQAQTAASFISGPGLPLLAAGVGGAAVLVTVIYTRRNVPESTLDWREMLRPEDSNTEDISWWIDQLSDDE